MTRTQIRTALDKLLGATTTESILHELRASIVRARVEHPAARRAATPLRDFLNALSSRGITGSVLRQLRTAAARSASRRAG